VIINRCLNAIVRLLNSWLSPHCPASLSQVTAVNYGLHQQITCYVLRGAWLLVIPTWSLTELPRFINDELRRKTNKSKTGEGVIYTAECGPGALTTLLCRGVVGKAVSVFCWKLAPVRTLIIWSAALLRVLKSYDKCIGNNVCNHHHPIWIGFEGHSLKKYVHSFASAVVRHAYITRAS